ncbi:MAG: DUF4097 family beta strand repeat-containing protein [Candidatus Acidiferrales bacterium]
MKNRQQRAKFKTAAIVVALMAVALSGCMAPRGEPGSLSRTFTVNGPVRLELTNSNGDSKVSVGAPGEVRIHADFQVKSWSERSAHQRMAEMTTNPPLSQEGNLIRVGGLGLRTSGVTIDYSIIVPPETEIHATTASGDVAVVGVRGPVFATSGSGNLSVAGVAGDVQARSGSGTIQLAAVQGQVQASTGSGDIDLAGVHGDTRLQTSSGAIQLSAPAGAVVATSGSGSISMSAPMDDVRVRTGSGNIAVSGDPPAGKYWDFHASSGNVAFQVSPNASFRFYARTRSGDIDAAIPVVMEGTAEKHALRARLGDGKGRVEVETSSGNVALH